MLAPSAHGRAAVSRCLIDAEKEIASKNKKDNDDSKISTVIQKFSCIKINNFVVCHWIERAQFYYGDGSKFPFISTVYACLCSAYVLCTNIGRKIAWVKAILSLRQANDIRLYCLCLCFNGEWEREKRQFHNSFKILWLCNLHYHFGPMFLFEICRYHQYIF